MCFTTKHKETYGKHRKRVHGVKRRCGGCQFVYPEVDARRYHKHVGIRHADQLFKVGIVIGKGKRVTGPTGEKVASVSVPKRPTDSPVDMPDCFGSTDPLHLCDSSWKEEPAGGFIKLLDEAGDTNIPLTPVKYNLSSKMC